MKFFMHFSLAAATVLLVVAVTAARAEDPRARELYGPSPHSDSGNCAVCHVAPREKLKAWYVWGSTKRQLTADPTTLCQRCHNSSNFGHGTGMKTSLNRANLPLNADGTINCALTCHDMHVESDDYMQRRYYLRHSGITLCTSCHEK